MLLLQDPPVPEAVVVAAVDSVDTEAVVVAAVDSVDTEAVVVVGAAVGDAVDESPVQSSFPLKLILITLGSWPSKVIMYSRLSFAPAASP